MYSVSIYVYGVGWQTDYTADSKSAARKLAGKLMRDYGQTRNACDITDSRGRTLAAWRRSDDGWQVTTSD